MLSAIFHTSDLTNHVPRILDSQHRSGIVLHSLSVEGLRIGGFEIRIRVAADSKHLEQMFLTRIAQMPGIIVTRHEFAVGKAVTPDSGCDEAASGKSGSGTQVA